RRETEHAFHGLRHEGWDLETSSLGLVGAGLIELVRLLKEENRPMGITDFFKGELIDVIEWTDDSRDTLSYRFPDDDKAIKNGAQLIVRESQVVQFVYLGAFGDLFGPGKHTLTT